MMKPMKRIAMPFRDEKFCPSNATMEIHFYRRLWSLLKLTSQSRDSLHALFGGATGTTLPLPLSNCQIEKRCLYTKFLSDFSVALDSGRSTVLSRYRMNRTMDEKEELVKKALFSFVRKQVPTAQLSLIDDIVLSYVVSMVEESALEEDLDVDGLCEMVSACLPEFSTIEKEAVSKWLLDVESKLRQGSKDNENCQPHDPLSHISLSALLPPGTQTMRVHHLSETSDAGSDSSGEYFSEESSWHQVALLQEMFPGASPAEARHCLAVAGGDIAKAAQLALHRQEAGQSIVSNLTFLTPNGRNKARVNDEELKSRIIARYSYVDRDDDSREHRPVAPKTEPKKLVRYLDNKIVSVKGERYTEVRRGGEDEDGNEGGRKRGHCRP